MQFNFRRFRPCAAHSADVMQIPLMDGSLDVTQAECLIRSFDVNLIIDD